MRLSISTMMNDRDQTDSVSSSSKHSTLDTEMQHDFSQYFFNLGVVSNICFAAAELNDWQTINTLCRLSKANSEWLNGTGKKKARSSNVKALLRILGEREIVVNTVAKSIVYKSRGVKHRVHGPAVFRIEVDWIAKEFLPIERTIVEYWHNGELISTMRGYDQYLPALPEIVSRRNPNFRPVLVRDCWIYESSIAIHYLDVGTFDGTGWRGRSRNSFRPKKIGDLIWTMSDSEETETRSNEETSSDSEEAQQVSEEDDATIENTTPTTKKPVVSELEAFYNTTYDVLDQLEKSRKARLRAKREGRLQAQTAPKPKRLRRRSEMDDDSDE